MSDEAKKQLIRYLLEEAFASNFTPLEAHRGLRESIPMLQHLSENTSDRALSFPSQFVANDWVVTVARRSYTSISPIFGFDVGQQHVTYDVLHLHQFDQEEIIFEYLQADFMSVMHQLGFDMPGAPPASDAIYPTSSYDLPNAEPEKAIELVRTTLEAIVHSEGDFDFLKDHPAYEAIIPDLEMRKAMSPDAEATFPLMVSDGEWVAYRSYWKQSFVGEMFGTQANGKYIEFQTLGLDRVADGKIVEHREFPDIPSMMRQLGTQAQ
jgi:predicted ester cyclase